MKKETSEFDISEKQNKKIAFAVLIAIFAILLFIAFALTVPWAK